MDTRAALFEQYGPLITYAELAKLLDRSCIGLRNSLSRRDTEISKLLGVAKVRVGRRVYFRTAQIADVLERQEAAAEAEELVSHQEAAGEG